MSKPRGASSQRQLAWAGGLVIATLAAQAGYEIWQGYRDSLRNIEQGLSAQARLIAEQTARGIQAIDVTLQTIAEVVAQPLAGEPDAAALHRLLKAKAAGLVQTKGLVLYGGDGQLRALSDLPTELVPPFNVRDMTPFTTLREQAQAGLVIDEVREHPADGEFVFPVARRVQDGAGRFLGVVGAPTRINYFQHFYRDAYAGTKTRIAMAHRDGRLLARYPEAPQQLGKPMSVMHQLLPLNSPRPAAYARVRSPVDGADIFVALRTVPGYPLVVAVSQDSATALAPWRSAALASALRTGLLGLLAGGLLWAALRQLQRVQRTQAELEVSQQRYELAMTGSRAGYWIWNVATDELYVSERYHELVGVPPERRIRTREELIAAADVNPADLEDMRRISQDLVNGVVERGENEFRVRTPQGERWIHTRAQRFEGEQGLRLAGVSVDITERKHAESQHQQLEAQLRQAQKMEAIGTLAGGIAHDFNNILASILGYGEMAQRAAPEGTAQRRHLDAVLAAAQRAKSLVERILAFSRAGLGQRVPVHVQSVVIEALETLQSNLPAGVRLQSQLQAGDAGVLGDPTQIHQVVLNLCLNAAQALKSEGQIQVRLDVHEAATPLPVHGTPLPAGRYLRLAVEDEGAGIPEALLARIFDPFFTTKAVGVGTGLGLSLVHGIVADLGGGIAVRSQEGVGSCFTIYLPLGAQVVVAPAPRAPRSELGHGETVMVVDDEESLVALAEEVLAELGYEAVGFRSADTALAALRRDPGRFDLLLSDEAMPGLSGTQLVEAARAVAPALRVVLMSGFVTPALQARARELGVLQVLNKPLLAAELAAALAQALRHKPPAPTGDAR
ncbi:MAG: ATP-binding protein [Inhella sp.]